MSTVNIEEVKQTVTVDNGDTVVIKKDVLNIVEVGAQGPEGAQGIQGIQGTQGEDGADGVSAIGEIIDGATQGSILFAGASGVLAQDNASLFFDDTNNRLGIGTSSPGAKLELETGTASTKGLIVQGAASQSANLTEWQTSAGTVLSRINAYGTFYAAGNSTNPNGYLFSNATNYGMGYVGGNLVLFAEGKLGLVLTPSYNNYRIPSNWEFSWSSSTTNTSASDTGLSRIGVAKVGVGNGTAGTSNGTLIAGNVGIGTTSPGARLDVRTGAAATKGLVVQGAASQTANLQEWQNSAGAVKSYVDNNGNFVMPNLPTSDPSIAGALYTVSGALMVSAG